MSPEPDLIDGDIMVRQLCADDVRPLYEAVRESIPEVSVWLPWCHQNYAIEETEEFIAARARADEEWYSFGVFDKESGRFLGGVGLNFFNRVHQIANLGYWVRTSAVGRGGSYAGDASGGAFWFHPTRPATHRDHCRR